MGSKASPNALGRVLIGVIDLLLAVAATIALPLMSKARRR